MVLKYIIFLAAFVFSLPPQDDGVLLRSYSSKIDKEIKSLYNASTTSLNRVRTDLNNLELYTIDSSDSNTDNGKGYLLLKEVRACSLSGCTSSSKPVGDIGYEYFDLSIILDEDKMIKKVKVLNYFSDYGYEISSKRYLKKYIGLDICSFSADDSQVDGISGATISYNALIKTMDELCGLVNG